MVLAAIQIASGWSRSRNCRISGAIPDDGGVKSYFRFPAARTRSGGAPATMNRRASSSDCVKMASGHGRTWRKNPLQRR